MGDSIEYCDGCETSQACHLERKCCSVQAKPDYPPNVKRFISKWQPDEAARQKAFWKEFRKAANAYSKFREND